jgi:hypothetical protein
VTKVMNLCVDKNFALIVQLRMFIQLILKAQSPSSITFFYYSTTLRVSAYFSGHHQAKCVCIKPNCFSVFMRVK